MLIDKFNIFFVAFGLHTSDSLNYLPVLRHRITCIGYYYYCLLNFKLMIHYSIVQFRMLFINVISVLNFFRRAVIIVSPVVPEF